MMYARDYSEPFWLVLLVCGHLLNITKYNYLNVTGTIIVKLQWNLIHFAIYKTV